MSALVGKVAVVTGASRGIGRGIAQVLGEEGATVYVTGRTAKGEAASLPGTLQQTADEIERRGGRCIPVTVDHANDDEVRDLFERIRYEQGRLDILVNNAFALPETLTEPGGFWEKPLSYWEMVNVGVRSSYVAAWHAAQLMTSQRSGLMVATSGYAGRAYNYGVVFGLCKSAVDRMARDMAIELKPYDVASVSLWLGLTLTERAERNLKRYPNLASAVVTNPATATSVEFPGRVIVALARDPAIMSRSGATCIAAELAREYAVTDIDGTIPPSLREQRGAPIWGPV